MGQLPFLGYGCLKKTKTIIIIELKTQKYWKDGFGDETLTLKLAFTVLMKKYPSGQKEQRENLKKGRKGTTFFKEFN